jgi:hypothetical protein
VEPRYRRATTRSGDRVAASVGLLHGHGAAIEFELVKDVPDGGVLLTLPSLLLLGLLNKSREMFSIPEGFCTLESIFLLLALMALARIPSLKALRYVAPGEWGKLIGLDRIPEVRILRSWESLRKCRPVDFDKAALANVTENNKVSFSYDSQGLFRCSRWR